MPPDDSRVERARPIRRASAVWSRSSRNARGVLRLLENASFCQTGLLPRGGAPRGPSNPSPQAGSAIDVLCANAVGNQQLATVRKEVLVLAGCTKAHVVLFPDLHRISERQSGSRPTQITEDIFKHIEVSLPLFVPPRVRCQVRQLNQRRAKGAHPNAGNSFNVQLYKTAIE